MGNCECSTVEEESEEEFLEPHELHLEAKANDAAAVKFAKAGKSSDAFNGIAMQVIQSYGPPKVQELQEVVRTEALAGHHLSGQGS